MFEQPNRIAEGSEELSHTDIAQAIGGLTLMPLTATAQGERRWSCISATTRIVHCRDGHTSEREFPRPAIVAILETVGGDLLLDCAGSETRVIGTRFPHISLVPAGATVRLSAPHARLFREVVIQIGHYPALLAAAKGAAVDFTPRMMLADKDVLRIAELIADDCLSGRPSDAVYGDSLSIVLFKALARLVEAGERGTSQGGLAPWQLRRITDFMETNLVGGARIEELAALVNLSSSYLIRAFKVSTGLTPLKWMQAARVRRAQQLLVEGRALADIAQESGFSDQAHLTRIFGQTIGESPGAWRRARQSGATASLGYAGGL